MCGWVFFFGGVVWKSTKVVLVKFINCNKIVFFGIIEGQEFF